MPFLPESAGGPASTGPQATTSISSLGSLNSGAAWLRALAVVSIVLMLALSTGLLLVQREATLERSRAQAQREVKRLAAELEQSLRLAQASIVVAKHPLDELLGDHLPLVQTLSLPFDLKLLEPPVTPVAEPPEAQWLPELAQADGGRWVIPLRWRQPAVEGGRAYEVTLPRDALLDRFASEGLPSGSSVSLFRVEDDGATTVLVRYPMAPQEQGRTLRGPVAEAVRRAPSGVFEAVSQLDGVHRIVGFQRLSGAATRLVVAYALPVQGVLSGWYGILPVAVALTLLLATAMAYGAWRLDRSMHALTRSERHFQTLCEHLPDVVLRADQTGRVLYVNPAVEAASGVRVGAMLGRTVEEFGTPPEIAAPWRACLQRVLGTGQAETLCFALRGPQGVRHWEAHVGLEVVNEGDTPTVLVINRDITARLEAETRQRSAQQLFETVFQAAPGAMSLSEWDSGRLLLVNDAFCDLFGRQREQLIGQFPIDMILWQSPSMRRHLIESLERGEAVRDAAASCARPDGRLIHVRYSAEQVQQDGQQRLLLLFRDVTELENEQRALARSELRFRLAASHGPVWERDFGQGTIQTSDEFFLHLGHQPPPPERAESAIEDLIHPEDLPRLRQMFRRFLKGEAGFRLEYRVRDALGRYRWFDTRGSGLRDGSGRVTYMAGTNFEITDRKTLEEAQRQTLNQLETVANASPVLFWTSRHDMRCDWVNQRWLEFTGHRLEDELNDDWTGGLHPDDRARCQEDYDRAFAAREPFSTEFRMLRHDGHYRWMLDQGIPRHDADGQFLGYIGSCVDLTDLKAAERSALHQRQLLEKIFDVLPDLFFLLDDEGKFIEHMASSEHLLYAPPDQLIGKRLHEVMPPEFVGPFMTKAMQARSGQLVRHEYMWAGPDGAHHFEARLARLPDSAQLMAIVRDISDQKRLENDRERLNQFVVLLFRLASRFINLPVSQMDAAINEALGDMGRFVSADRACLFHYDFAARTSSSTHEWCAEGVVSEQTRLQNMPLDWSSEWVAAHQRGELIYVHDVDTLSEGPLKAVLQPLGTRSLMSLPLIGPDACLGYVCLDSVCQQHGYDEEKIALLRLFAQMLVNLKLRADAEAQIRELTGQLEQKVAVRTIQLEDSVKRLQAVNRELESFTYSASHDLRTPLRGIEGFSTLLLMEYGPQLDDRGRGYLQRIHRATLHMSQLISDLLAYARLEQMTEQARPLELATLVQEVVLPFRDGLNERQGQLQVEVASALRVMADPKGLSLVLRNLLDNALKFTPTERAPEIRIEAHALDGAVHLQVADRGMGFDMRHHERIFGMFQRLHRQDQIPGTGIGLAMAHKAIERMAGRIWAESAPGQGARFHIELPRG